MTALLNQRKTRSTVLIIDPDSLVAESLSPYLLAFGITTRTAAEGAKGELMAGQENPTLILLARTLPDTDGMTVFKTLRNRSRTAHIPIMILAGANEADRHHEVLNAGAYDFIAKPFDAQLVTLRIRNAITRAERDGLTHPRSGLPTGALMTERVRALADEFGWSKIDLSIENFDSFTARYGFMSGDDVIAFTANLLIDVVRVNGRADDFIGHRDDVHFSIISDLAHGTRIAELLETRFNKEVQSFYSFAERDQGFVALEEGGETVQRPLMAARIRIQEGDPE